MAITYQSLGQTATFTASKTEGCSPLIVFFDASSSTGSTPLTYHWDFGNGNQIKGDDANPGASYKTSGTYQVTLVVIDADSNKSAPATKQITVLENPKANFYLDNSAKGCLPHDIELINTSEAGSSPIKDYLWSFGDGTLSIEKSPSKQYFIEGIYNIKLIVTDENGCKNNHALKDKVIAIAKPEVSISTASSFTCEPSMEVNFKNSNQESLLPGVNYSYLWNFGDGTTSSEKKPKKKYTSEGIYDVSLQVVADSFGCMGADTVREFISVGAPLASFDVELTESCNQFDADFTITSPMDSVFRYTWHFGDGKEYTGTLKNGIHEVSHSYTSGGSYEVTLVVEDSSNTACFAEYKKVISFQNNFKIDFESNQTAACSAPLSINFTYKGDTASTFHWDFGNGSTSAEKNPVISISENGHYDVTLTVTDANGCSYTIAKENVIRIGEMAAYFQTNGNEVNSVPELFSGNPNPLRGDCTDEIVDFNDNSYSPTGIAQWEFDYGDGSPPIIVTDGEIPSRFYNEGVYSPSLKILSPDGCTATYQCDECVIRGEEPETKVEVLADSFNCCGYTGYFDNQTDTASIDFLWYIVTATGETRGYYKEDNSWSVVNSESAIPADGDWDYTTNVEANKCGTPTDMTLYTYNKGCQSKKTIPEWQTNIPPRPSLGANWNTDCITNWYPGMEIDFNDTIKFHLNWNWYGNGTVDSVRLTWDVQSFNQDVNQRDTCGFTIDTTYTSAEQGFLLQELNCEDPQQVITKKTLIADSMRAHNMFPRVKIPGCFVPNPNEGTEISIYVKDTTSRFECPCETPDERFFVTFTPPQANVSVSEREGCAPLEVQLTANPSSSVDGAYWSIFSEHGSVPAQGLNPTVTLTEPGKYLYRLTLIDDDCQIDSVYQDTIYVKGPRADFEMSNQHLCFNQGVQMKEVLFTDNSVSFDSIISRSWSFGNGDTNDSNSKIVASMYEDNHIPAPELQKYGLTASLQVEDANGCISEYQDTLFLRKILPDFDYSITPGCLNEVAFVIDESSGKGPFNGYYSINEIKGSDTLEIDQVAFNNSENVSAYLNNGTYAVFCQVESDSLGNCGGRSSTKVITVDYPTVVPGFYTDEKIFKCPPAIVSFTDTSSHENNVAIVHREWNFTNLTNGESGISYVQNPMQIFDNSGYFNVVLKVTDALGCTKEVRKDSLIFIEEVYSNLELSSDSVCVGVPFVFDAEYSDAISKVWDLGDGVLLEEDVVEYTYEQTGIRYPSLILEFDDSNCNTSVTDTLYVVEPPILDLGADLEICEGESTLLQSNLAGQYSHQWSTGATDFAIDISEEGYYALTIADDIEGCADTDSVYLKINSKPIAEILPADRVCEGDMVQLSANSSPNTDKLEWHYNGIFYGNGDQIQFNLKEDVEIQLIAISEKNCIDTLSQIFQAIPLPEFNLQDASICPGDSFLVEQVPINYDYTDQQYTWLFENNIIQSKGQPEIVLHEEGIYHLQFSSSNCQGSDSMRISFHPLPATDTNEDLVVFCIEDEIASLDAGENASWEWLPPLQGADKLATTVTEGTYYLYTINDYGCRSLDSIMVESRCEPQFFIPDAFSPNGDNENEQFIFFFQHVGDFEFTVFNRWGEVIFQSNDKIKFWDGYYKGSLMPAGVYPWLLKFTGDNPDFSREVVKQGKVTLLR